MPGAISPNLHEGSRSEYLAQYVFASFGTAIAVPHPEDSGVDLYCTLVERKGQCAWPIEHFTVQVKSSMEPWKFEGEESVRWAVQHPLPLLLCVVDKSAERLTIYHTGPRCFVWSLPPLPSYLELVPGEGSDGRCTQWEGGCRFSLSAPILDFTTSELSKGAFREKAAEVLRFWVSVEAENLHRIKMGMHSFTMPDGYRTNTTRATGITSHHCTRVGKQNLMKALHNTRELLNWLSGQLYEEGDLEGAVRGAMLVRWLFKDSDARGSGDAMLQVRINDALRVQGRYVYEGVDELNKLVSERLLRNSGP
jgi:hypothetical protein